MSGLRETFPGGSPRAQRGVTLVELMVALVLGLVVSGAALALFMTNKQVYMASENLDRVQETSRTAFELMARDIREADGNPCSNEVTLSNGLKNATTYAWWSNWGEGLQGYDGGTDFKVPDKSAFGTAQYARVAGTQAVELWNAVPTDVLLTDKMGLPNDALKVTTTTGKVAANDILVICGPSGGASNPPTVQGAIFQATAVGANSISHGTGGTPSNVNDNIGPEVYGAGSVISRMAASRWYIGYNGRTDSAGNKLKSLYRTSMNGATAKPDPDEIVEGVTGMTLAYHRKGGGTYDAAPASWADVDAVQIALDLASRDKVGTDQKVLSRHYEHVVAIRSRAQ